MGLADMKSIASLLVCPRCRSPLERTNSRFKCPSAVCDLSSEQFPQLGEWPLLVDFERSIIDAAALRSRAAASAPITGSRKWAIERLPRPLRPLWHPKNRIAARNIRLVLKLLPSSARVVVVGGGTVGSGIESLYRDPRISVVGFDVYGSEATQFIADAHHIPLATGSIDAVVIQAVLEHVLDPSQVVSEIHRILRAHGLVYAETPFLQQVHGGPYDFTRYTFSGHRYLFRRFEEISAGSVAGPGTQLLWSVDHLARALARFELAGKLARAACFWLRYLDHVVSPRFALDDASAYYFLGRRAERDMTPREIVSYYSGAQCAAASRRGPRELTSGEPHRSRISARERADF
jgi:ubiquinone/menaquinone biosynthesis C-methylase UbiE